MSRRCNHIAAFVLGVVVAFAPPLEAEDAVLRVGYSLEKVDLGSRMTEKDVVAATQILMREMLRERTDLAPEFRVFKSTADLMAAVFAGEIDFIEIHPLDYFRLEPDQRAHFRPGILVQFGETRLEKIVLLGRPGQTLASAVGKSLRLYRGRDRGIGDLWLDSILARAGLPVAKEHFGEVTPLHRAEEVLLPTFFGKADFCLAVEADYKVAVELNPQIGRRLVPIETSPGVPFVMAGATSAVSAEFAQLLNREIAPSVPLDPGGRQALALLGVKRITEIEPGDLSAIEAIILETAQLRSGTATQSATARTRGEEP